ncbi:23S rRNA (pseudouridine(1915)-N(3))-methyltransferase RlmH [Helicobacter cinaedi]|uniref:23S rRNA (pseudouridine(1915)-N(3))-methyltransferase RlmH n=1 Tax=Helicobacter cinaedi TaxID=213 RepID=UPI000D7BCB27|nr:23S rRNA (pseudouridine(1915)-N(3))-methyltransferase RlmH [Helicobacter cinaedi]
MQINIYSIAKKDIKYQAVQEELCMQCRQFGAYIESFELMPQNVLKAQKISATYAKNAYTQAFLPHIKPNALNLALHPQGKSYDSQGFSRLLDSQNIIQFFIGGAYGFEKEFLNLCQSISLSTLTLSHKIAKLVLCEQIYRALSILQSHPYHK